MEAENLFSPTFFDPLQMYFHLPVHSYGSDNVRSNALDHEFYHLSVQNKNMK
jgi:hypothetical protein